MLTFASENNLQNNLSFSLANAECFSLGVHYDYVVSFNALHWVENYHSCFLSIKNALKANGKILLLFTAVLNDERINHVIYSKKWSKAFAKLIMLSEIRKNTDFSKILTSLGFSSINLSMESLEYTYTAHKDMINHLMTWIPAVTGLSKTLSLNVASEISDRYFKNCNNQAIFKLPINKIVARI